MNLKGSSVLLASLLMTTVFLGVPAGATDPLPGSAQCASVRNTVGNHIQPNPLPPCPNGATYFGVGEVDLFGCGPEGVGTSEIDVTGVQTGLNQIGRPVYDPVKFHIVGPCGEAFLVCKGNTGGAGRVKGGCGGDLTYVIDSAEPLWTDGERVVAFRAIEFFGTIPIADPAEGARGALLIAGAF